MTLSFAGSPQISRSTCSSTVRGSGSTSVLCRSHLGTGLGGSSTSLSMRIQVRSSHRILLLAGRMTVPKFRPSFSKSLNPWHRSPQMVRTTRGSSTKQPMSKAKGDRCGCSFHLDVTPSSARSPRPRSRREIETSAPSENSDDASGTRTQGTASAAWSRTPCTDTRRSSVEVCEVEPSMGSKLKSSWRAGSSTP